MQYDLVGRLRSISPPGRPQHEFEYSPVGLVAQYVPPVIGAGPSQSTRYTYDREGRIDFVTLPDGGMIDRQYDLQNGRLLRVSGPKSQSAFSYTPGGLVESIARTDSLGSHVLDMEYDGVLATSETWRSDSGGVEGSVGRAFDDHFRIRELKVNGDAVAAYGYDQDNLLLAAGPMIIAHRPDNGVISGTRIGQLTTRQELTRFGELDEASASYASQLLYDEKVTEHDKFGRVVHRNDMVREGNLLHQRSYQYGYDGAGRLVDVFENDAQVSHYEYGANGNRTDVLSGAAHIVARYDDQDRLMRYCPEDANGNAVPASGAPCFTYGYASTGRLQSRTDLLRAETTQYEYDEFGTLRRVQFGDGRTIDYEIDAVGRRVGKYVDGVKQWGLLYQNGLTPIAQLDADNNVVSVFVYGTRASVPDYMIRNGFTYRFVTDQRGSVRLVVDVATGDVVEQVEYDEFGNATLVSGSWEVQPFAFAGGLYDLDTGLVQFGARDYDATTGRWTSKDPIFFGAGQPNLYVYAGSDPINSTDPSGLDSLWFTGKYLYWLSDNGDKIGEWDANSGYGVCPDDCEKPITEGHYTVEPKRRQPSPYISWGPMAFRLKPDAETQRRINEERTDDATPGHFYIHGGGQRGTSGCIELAWGKDQSQLEDFWKRLRAYGQPIDLLVTYEPYFPLQMSQ